MAGNANSGRKRNAFVTEALIIEMKARDNEGDKKGVRALAIKVWEEAEKGERWAAEFVRDTIDGRPIQAIEGGLEHTIADPLMELLARISGQGKRLGSDDDHQS